MSSDIIWYRYLMFILNTDDFLCADYHIIKATVITRFSESLVMRFRAS